MLLILLIPCYFHGAARGEARKEKPRTRRQQYRYHKIRNALAAHANLGEALLIVINHFDPLVEKAGGTLVGLASQADSLVTTLLHDL